MTPVIDASVAIKWFIWEEGTDVAHQLLDRLSSFYVPNLFLMEIDAILTKKVRKKKLTVADSFQKRRVFRELPYKLISYGLTNEFAFRLATEFPITQYDATYLAIAVDYDVIFHTADKRLVNGMSNTPFGKHFKLLEY